MKCSHVLRSLSLAAVMAGSTLGFVPDETGFSFQGQLKQGGVPVNDTCDMVFQLWRDPLDANPVLHVGTDQVFDGAAGNPDPVEVENGIFQVTLDFGPFPLANDPLWLEIAVACPSGSGSYTGLTPRQPLTGAPYSVQTRGLYVDGNGQVGVGMDFPTEMLEVNGNIALVTEGSDPYIELRSDDAADATRMFLRTEDTKGFVVSDSPQGTDLLVENGTGAIGMGTDDPEAQWHLKGRGAFFGNHVALIDSQSGPSSDGLAIRLGTDSPNRDNNFVTFLSQRNFVAGRIEGFDLENGDWISPPPLPNVSLTVDPGVKYNPNWFDAGQLPNVTFDPGRLPTLILDPGELPTVSFNRGSLPTASLNRGALPSLIFSGGSLPSLSFNRGQLPDVTWSRGTLPSLSFSRGSLPSLSINFFSGNFSFNPGSLPSATFSTGSLPSLSFDDGQLPTASFNRGSLPTATFNRGSLPSLTFTGGALPSLLFSGGELPSASLVGGEVPELTFDGGRLPAILAPPVTFNTPSIDFTLPTPAELEALFCWSVENGVTDFMTMDPISLASVRLKEAALTVCKDDGVTYGSKGADYAEWLPKANPEDRFQFGQVVGIKDGKVSLNTAGAEQVMAVSRQPVVVGNVPPKEEESKFVTVGFMGQLPVVVRGIVKIGDYIVPSGYEDGTAVAVAAEDLQIQHLGRIVGRAWSESDNDIYSLINVTIGLDNNEVKTILQRQQDQIAAQARQQLALTSENARLKTQLASMNAQLEDVLVSIQQIEDSMNAKSSCRLTAASVGEGR